MTTATTMHIDPESDLGKVLRTASEGHEKLIVRIGDESYELHVARSKSSSKLEKPTPEEAARSREAILKTAGSWKGNVDAEELIAYIREQRLMPSRGGRHL